MKRVLNVQYGDLQASILERFLESVFLVVFSPPSGFRLCFSMGKGGKPVRNLGLIWKSTGLLRRLDHAYQSHRLDV
jgi:hypothetical protein